MCPLVDTLVLKYLNRAYLKAKVYMISSVTRACRRGFGVGALGVRLSDTGLSLYA